LTSTLHGDEWSTSCPGHFTTGVISPKYPLDRRLGKLQSQSEHGSEEKKIPTLPLPGTEPWSSNPQPNLYTDWATPGSWRNLNIYNNKTCYT